MKDFTNWGIRIRKKRSKNYYSIWENLVTTRLDMGETRQLNAIDSEFFDVGITERCNAMCPFCYVEANSTKKDYPDICESWDLFIKHNYAQDVIMTPENDSVLKELLSKPTGDPMDMNLNILKLKSARIYKKYGATYTEKPFQIAIGSVGEPTVHPQFPEFLETVYKTQVVPNYTTNGIILAEESDRKDKILEATRNYCGGVAVSFGNKSLRTKAMTAIETLLGEGDCKVMIHEIIGSKEDVDDFMELEKVYGKDVHYHVLLPLMDHGRSDKKMDTETYRYLIESINKNGFTNVAFGANFLPFFEKEYIRPNVWEYPQETYSKNLLLKSTGIEITPSSFNLKPIVAFPPILIS